MLVRSPLLIGHKWRELVSSRRELVLFFSVVWFVLYCLSTTVCVLSPFLFLPFFVSLEMLLFPSIFVPLPFSLCMKSTSEVFSFRMVFFCLMTTGRIFEISVCDNSINQSNNVILRIWFGLVCYHSFYYIARARINRVRLPILHVVS